MVAVPRDFLDPPNEFSLMPLWFWNDSLDEAEIVRQIADFEQHGVYGFVIHPRVGLPRELGWMSDRLLDFYQVAIEEAHRRRMHMVLYDEGAYPSGSSSGQVVAANPAFARRCLAKIDLTGDGLPDLAEDQNLVVVVPRRDGCHMAVIDRKADCYIRGLHYIDGGPAEDEPAASDLLNTDAVATFVRLVYDRFAERFSRHFGETIYAIFTDEPGLLAKCRESGVMPGTTGILEHVNRYLGYDFTPHLPALWYDEEPDAERFRRDYFRAVRVRLGETYYRQLYAWCEKHGLPLTGHPHQADDIGVLRYFHIPGQDLVWRWVLPDQPSALEGAESTQGKCSSSAALHGGRRRNSNECCGAYGHQLTWDEMCWLANWCAVRGVNLLFPHAFYYSVRGPRRDERPPDVGPNAPWWDRYKHHADACRRLSWLNTDSVHVCDIAILGKSDYLPWRPARACFLHQRDFNYLEERDLLDRAVIDDDGIHVGGMTYGVLIFEYLPDPMLTRLLEPMERAGRLIRYVPDTPDSALVERIGRIVPADVSVRPALPALRVRHVRKAGFDWYLLFNEEKTPLDLDIRFRARGERWLFDPATGRKREFPNEQPLHLSGHELTVVMVGQDCPTGVLG